MTDYPLYCSSAGITNRQMIEKLQEEFPRYQKATQTMVCNPDMYAVQLTPEAEEKLVAAFGSAPGLSSYRRKKTCHRVKANRLYVRLNDELYSRVTALKKRMGFATMQEFIEAALMDMLNKYGGWME